MLSDLLDQLDTKRFDTGEIVERLNCFSELSDAEQHDELNSWEYSGLADAQHVLSELIPEAHNTAVLVRDLAGDLEFIWDDPRDGVWRVGPLFADHLMGGETLAERIERAEGPLSNLDPTLVERICVELPSAPGPVVSY